jgi:dihydrofolate reductase
VDLSVSIVGSASTSCRNNGKDILLVGGGKLISMLLSSDLIDEMQICYIPVILGKGIKPFPENTKQSQWKIVASELYSSGILKVDCKK